MARFGLLLFIGLLSLNGLWGQSEEDLRSLGPVYALARSGDLLGAQDMLIEMRDTLANEGSPFLKREVLILLGQVAYNLRDFDLTIASARACLTVEVPDSPLPVGNLASIYDMLGWSLYLNSEMAESRETLGEGFRVAKAGLGGTHPLTLQLMAKYGKMRNETAQMTEAKSLLLQATQLTIQAHGPEFGLLPFLYTSLGETYARLEQYDSTLHWYQQAIDFQEAALGLVHHNVFSSYNEKAWALRKMGQPQAAHQAMQVVLSRLDQLDREAQYEFLVFYKTGLGHALNAGACEDAEHIVNVLEAALRHSDSSQIAYFSYEASMAELYIFLAQHRIMCQGDDPALLREADSLIQHVAPLLQELLSEFTTRETVMESAKQVNAWMQRCLGLLWQSYQREITSPETFFDLLEQANGFSYVKQRAFWRSLEAESVPDSLRTALETVSTDILSLDQQVQQAEGTSQDSLQSLRVSQYRERDRLSARIQALSPDYVTLSETLDRARLQEVQQALAPDEGMLSYFMSDTLRMAIVITADKFLPVRLPVDTSLFTQIERFRTSLYAPYLIANPNSPDYRSQTAELGAALYAQLMAPVAEHVPEHLIILPSNTLSLLPFEALLTQPTSPDQPYSQWPFLLKKYTLSYALSATQWLDSRKKDLELPEGELLAVAPDFSSGEQLFAAAEPRRRGYLGPLPFAQHEVDTLLTLFEGTSLKGKEATLKAFQDLASQHRILHLATHGKVNEVRSDFSFLAFYGPEDSLFLDEKETVHGISPLYFSDLYRMRLPSEMVVLSACETGIGKVYLGEGLASIAQGFSYAGAQSVVTTLWSVNDQQTTRFMQTFYAGLKEGLRKDEALRAARLELLEENAAPFFWAGFIGIGNMAPLQQTALPAWWVWILVAGLLIGGLVWFLRKR